MTETTTIHHYNKLEGVDRILTELYNVAMKDVKHDVNDPYSQGLLKAILMVAEAQKHLSWKPSNPEDDTIQIVRN